MAHTILPSLFRPFISPTFCAIRSHNGAVTHLLWEKNTTIPQQTDPKLLTQVQSWLRDYFAGEFRPVDFPLTPQGSDFQQRLWQQVKSIAPGQTMTYKTLAEILNSSPRAVGQGMGSNPIPLFIPCHRVIGVKNLGGFSAPGGITSKQWLLAWEQKHHPNNNANCHIGQ